ncbi:glycosyltransferase family 87 protein [Burkholderia stagnalis]
MDIPRSSIRAGEHPVRAWLTPGRIAFYSAIALAVYVIFVATWVWFSHRSPGPAAIRPGADYVVFWTASWLMRQGLALQAYDIPTFWRLLLDLFPATPRNAFLPWLYPPTYLLLVAPLSLLPFALSYPLFIATGIAALGVASWHVSGLAGTPGMKRIGWLALLGCPGIYITTMYGQNAMLTASCAALAVYWVDRRPAWAGFCIGLMVVKPQMAMLFPFVLISARAWRTFAWAALFATAFAALGVLVCGVGSLNLFLHNTALARSLILEHNIVFWFTSPTPFAALRLAEVPLPVAYAVQACIAAVAIASACTLWARNRDTRVRGAALVIATLAANPYVWHYELSWLCIALACLLALGTQDGWLRGEQTVVALVWALPIYEYLNPLFQLPQIGSIVVLGALLVLLRRTRSTGDSQRAALRHTH